ncbi:thioredoxin family protein [Belnapia sp. T6]|uniref:Thioredoxin family protein n=2 Tax=Belnapia mucosa TaxID=2804532 RepID=A0ABS1V4I6_9PROT|nr:thioredoxin family protein [Belnapia mucosa]
MRPFVTLLILLAGLAAAPAGAVESAAVRSPRATATLVADRLALAPGEEFRLGLRLRLAPGWHSYWRNAGDAGAAPELALTLPEGATAGTLEFPAPSRIATGPLMSFGYEGEVLLPARATASATADGAMHVEAEANWLVCADLCIPEEGRFRLTLPVAPAGRLDPALAPLFAATEAALPRPSPWTARAALEGARGSLRIDGAGLSPGLVREAAFFPDEPGLIQNAAPQALRLRDGGLTLGLRRPEGAAVPATLSGVMVLVDAGGQRSAYAVAAPVGGAVEAAEAGLPLWQVLGSALLGGLLLNLMPCVFPILAMKAMALARLSGAARGAVRAHAASYTAGVLVSFLALAGMLIGLRGAGLAAGWGFQFTAPAFVAVLAWLMLAIGLNLSGVYAVGGPAGAGAGLAARGGHAGSFFTGVLAVLVATPCTAPFMAAAVGAALTLPPAETLLVFAALGLGLAAPYALLGLFPSLAGLLPRPGGWMEALRGALAFPMYGAAAWLAWVLAQQAGPDGLLLLLGGAVLIGFAAWALGLAQRGGGRAGRLLAGAAAIGALALLPGLTSAPPAMAGAEAAAEAWSPARVAALQAEGRPVFVNMTAAWCITCKVNEQLVLRSAPVQAAFAGRNLAYLKGDWTGGDAVIGALLREHGREGVPLYLVYPAGGGAPQVLPQLLTEGIVLRAVEAAAG